MNDESWMVSGCAEIEVSVQMNEIWNIVECAAAAIALYSSTIEREQ